MAVLLIKICSAIIAIVLLVTGIWFIYQPEGLNLIFSSINLWEETAAFDRKDSEIEFQSSGDLEWKGLKWDLTVQVKTVDTTGGEDENCQDIIEQTQADEEKSFKILDRIHCTMLLQKSRLIQSNKFITTFWMLRKSDFDDISSSEIGFMRAQIKDGLFISLKVVGSDFNTGIGQTLKRIHGSRHQNTYRFSSSLYIIGQRVVSESDSGNLTLEGGDFYSTRGQSSDDHWAVRVPRNRRVKPNYSWFTFSYWFTSTTHTCVLYAREVKDHGFNFVPEAIISFLICY